LAALGTHFPTMYDSPPAGFAELLLQSQPIQPVLALPLGSSYSGHPYSVPSAPPGPINLLPALPSAWASGEILGLRARGGYEIDIRWKDHQLVAATIRSLAGSRPLVEVGGKVVDLGKDSRIKFLISRDAK